jgi:hypothetical protein
MFDNLIIADSTKIISILKNLGFTKFEKFKGDVYINNLHYSHAMRNIRIELREEEINVLYGQLIDVIKLLAYKNINLETDPNPDLTVIPKQKTPQINESKGFFEGRKSMKYQTRKEGPSNAF